MVALLAIVFAALLAATPAWASSVSDVSVQFDRPPAYAGEEDIYIVSFTTTSRWLTANDSITISAPAGTVFPDGGYAVNDAQARILIPNSNVVLSDGGSTVTINLTGTNCCYAPPGTRVSVILGVVTNPPEPGQYTLDVHTSDDTTPATSAPYTISPRLITDPPPAVPTAKEQCKKGGYEAFGFRNQGQCVAFVQRGSKN